MKDRSERRRVSANLRTLRERAGLSQDELAARVSMSQSKLSRVERGYVCLSEHERAEVAKELGVLPDRLAESTAEASAEAKPTGEP